MRERAEAEGGRLEILSKKGEGTSVIVTVPLEADGKAG
jgi:signal transduction histidine kinase